MSLLKDVYSPAFYERLSRTLTEVVPGFDKKKFIQRIFTASFKDMELKQRMRHTAEVLHEFVPTGYPKAIKLLRKAIIHLRESGVTEDGLAYLFLPDFVEVYGLEDYDTSVAAIEFITQFVSCEFAVRPFLLKYEQQMLAQMRAWSLHKNYKVRRLASEGSRPRLPWAMAVPALKKAPTPILPILENLKNDPSEWVRRSVANSLNDIAKDHPDIVLGIARRWKGHSKETDAIIKHGSRTLLKQGHTEILQHYGLESKNIQLSGLKMLTPEIKIGQSLEFSFTIINKDPSPLQVRLEYAVYYKKQNGTLSKKVFKISERVYQPGEKAAIHRKQKFVLITTRKFYAGSHQLSIIVNGEEKKKTKFELLD
jgi:3-methyladenine DNA glycosylase AlkC